MLIRREARSTRAARPSDAAHTFALYALFGLTGVGLVLPGTLLPFLVRHWGWQDGRSGLLFFLFFVGTTLGAFCARGMLGRMLVVAAFATALPFATLVVLQGVFVFAAILAGGFGIGLTMTAVTLLRSRQRPDARAAELNRLNLVWAIGAVCAPFLLLRSVQHLGLPLVLSGFAAVIFLFGCAAGLPLWSETVPPEGAWSAWKKLSDTPWVFLIGLPLATGIEAGIGAWLVTYSLRVIGTHSVVTASTALWAGLLCSRLLFSSHTLGRGYRRHTGSAFTGLLVGGLLLLLKGDAVAVIIAAAFCVGFGIGPLYPQLLALLLSSGETGNAGFLVAGAGSALLPLVIGQVSQHVQSLRTGLVVPLAGSVVLLVAFLRAEKGSELRSHG